MDSLINLTDYAQQMYADTIEKICMQVASDLLGRQAMFCDLTRMKKVIHTGQLSFFELEWDGKIVGRVTTLMPTEPDYKVKVIFEPYNEVFSR